MISYIIRRLLLVIPTVLGITFLIFMLVANAKGGIGAALQASSGQMDQSDRARQEAYLEERYGLKDPVAVQYFRWLSRVSPIKFGLRDQVRDDGEVIRTPKALEAPILAGEWYGPAELPPPPAQKPPHEFNDQDVVVPDAPRAGEVIGSAPAPTVRWLVLDNAAVSQGQMIAEIAAPVGAAADDPEAPPAEAAEPILVRSPVAGLLRQAVPDGSPATPGAAIGRVEERRDAAYVRVSDRYARARAAFVGSRALLEDAIRSYANWGADRVRVHNDAQQRLRERRALRDDPGDMPPDQLQAIVDEIAELEGRLLTDSELQEAQDHRDRFRGAVTSGNDLRADILRRRGLDPAHERAAAIVAAGEQALADYAIALEQREALMAMYRAKPFPEAGFWVIPGLVSVATPDLGVSFSRGSSVVSLIRKALPVTLLLNIIAFPMIYMLAVPTGLLAAVNKGRLFDHLSGAMVVGLWSIPTLVASVLMVGFLASRTGVLGENHFPTGFEPAGADAMLFLPSRGEDGSFRPGLLLTQLHHMMLPLIALIYPGLAILTKQTRAAMLDNFSADYVRTAKAKGVSGRNVIFRHVLRNSLLPLITMFATIFPAMLGGSIIVERVFNIEGMGKLILDAIYLRDRELLLANVMMITCVNLLALLLADILYAVADPRISYS